MLKITHSDGPAAAASGDIVGLLRLKLVSERDDESTNRSTYRLKWSGTAGPMPTEMSIGGSRTHALFELRCGRSDVVQYINATPQRQALEVSCECESAAGSEGKATVFSGFVPLASLIERLSAADDANFQVADIPVVLKARTRSPRSTSGGGDGIGDDPAERKISLSVTIDVSFGDEAALASLDGKMAQLWLDAGARQEMPPGIGHSASGSDSGDSGGVENARHTSLVLGRDSLDDVSSEPGWPLDARRMDVQPGYVYFDKSHAPLHMNDNATVYLSLATQQDGKDQRRTGSVGFAAKQKQAEGAVTGGSPVKGSMMFAEWKSEVVTFDPLSLDSGCGARSRSSSERYERHHNVDLQQHGSHLGQDALRVSTDSYQSHQSHQSHQSSVTSPTAKPSPILRVGLWKSVTIVDQFHSFSGGGAANDSLIGSAVVVVTGALGEEEGIEIPLYDDALQKSGVVHLKIGMGRSRASMDGNHGELGNQSIETVDERSQLNYEILSNMDALKRQVMPTAQPTTRRYAMSGSSDDSDACLGVAYEGAVSDFDDGDVDDVVREGQARSRPQERVILQDEDWMFNIEKQTGD